MLPSAVSKSRVLNTKSGLTKGKFSMISLLALRLKDILVITIKYRCAINYQFEISEFTGHIGERLGTNFRESERSTEAGLIKILSVTCAFGHRGRMIGFLHNMDSMFELQQSFFKTN